MSLNQKLNICYLFWNDVLCGHKEIKLSVLHVSRRCLVRLTQTCFVNTNRKLIAPSPVPSISSAEQIGQRSSSVDFTVFPAQRRDLQAVSAAARSSAEGSPTPRRAGSIKRNDSVKRSDSMKKKKARPMIWDHFDDVPHTRWARSRKCLNATDSYPTFYCLGIEEDRLISRAFFWASERDRDQLIVHGCTSWYVFKYRRSLAYLD